MKARLDNIAPVLVSPDVRRTAGFYCDVLGFEAVEHYEAPEPFVTLYRDSVEIVVVQAAHGQVESNVVRYGAGYDVYLDSEDLAGIDLLYDELIAKSAHIVSEPKLTPYGSYEFVLEDIDGRRIGIGRIKDKDVFFRGKLS
ncbi:MAG: VOC family protein [Gaiellaceae bacterium]